MALGPLNVLVGPNGAGKSNLLDVIRFLGDSVRSDLAPALDVRGGFDAVVFRGAKPKFIELEVIAQVTSHSSGTAQDEYALSFRVLGGGKRSVLVREESFKFKRTARQGRRITIDGGLVEVVDKNLKGKTTDEKTRRTELLRNDSLGLATLPRLAENEGGRQVAQIADLFSTFRVVDIDVAAARLPSLVAEAEVLESDASNLSAFLFYLTRADPGAFGRLVDDAREFVPGLEELHFEPVGGAGEAVVLELVERWLPGRTRLADASYGTIRALALLAVLYDPDPPLLTCMEEVDHGLHPYVFDRLVDRLREASERTQLLLATHSPALVGRLATNELIVCERDQFTGSSRIPAVTTEEMEMIKAAVEDRLDLGELWFSGTLGGVPR